MKRPVGICRVLCIGLVLVGLVAGCEKNSSNSTDGQTTWALSREESGWCTYKHGQYTTSKAAPVAGGCAASIVVVASGEE